MTAVPPELYHRIAEADSATARRRAGELGVGLELRNVHFESHAAALRARGGGDGTPALWDGERLYQGLPAVLEALERLAGRQGAGPGPSISAGLRRG